MQCPKEMATVSGKLKVLRPANRANIAPYPYRALADFNYCGLVLRHYVRYYELYIIKVGKLHARGPRTEAIACLNRMPGE